MVFHTSSTCSTSPTTDFLISTAFFERTFASIMRGPFLYATQHNAPPHHTTPIQLSVRRWMEPLHYTNARSIDGSSIGDYYMNSGVGTERMYLFAARPTAIQFTSPNASSSPSSSASAAPSLAAAAAEAAADEPSAALELDLRRLR